MKRITILLILGLSLQIQAQTLKIAAAGSLRFVLEEIKASYKKKNPNTEINVTVGSSGMLFQQISNGADYDVFMAADNTFPNKLKTQGMIIGDVKVYALGKLVVWSNSIDVSKGIDAMFNPAVHKIAIAKPELAPFGERAIECLNYYKYFEKVKDKIVYADNIAQAAQFAQTGNAEIGFLALSLAIDPEMKGKYFVLDTKSYKPIEQALVALKKQQQNPETAKFIAFVLSKECKTIFEKYGM
jgi:molybdate transport system substrate-binding protein